MVQKSAWQPSFSFFIFLFIHIFLLENSFIISFIKSYLLYLFFGGWRFQRILFLTFRRDMRGVRCLVMATLNCYWSALTGSSMGDLFRTTLRKRGPNQPAFYYEDLVWTLGDLEAYSNKVANLLLQSGMKRGDKLFLYMRSHPAYVGIWLGAAKIGVVTALINFNLRKSSLVHCLNAVDAKAIVIGSEFREAFEDLDDSTCRTKFLSEDVWFVDERASVPESAHSTETDSIGSWNRALTEVSPNEPPPQPRITNVREHLIYVYTSGTCGLPKAAIITKFRYIWMTVGLRYSFGVYHSDTIYTALPLYHTAGGILGVGQVLLYGTPMVIRGKFSASQFWTDCIKYKCTVAQYIGEICRYVTAQPPRPTDTQHSVRLAFGNGLRRETWIKFQERFKVPQIGEVYGATESTASIINSDNTVGAVGFLTQILPRVYPLRLIKMDLVTEEPVRDRETGFCIECGPDEPGQMISKISRRNPLRVFDGYVNKQASDKKMMRNVFKEGDVWFASGDLMYRDELGYLFFSDRLGDTFRWHGENVSTAEVESVLLQILPPEMNSTVYGVPVPNTEGKAGAAAIVVEELSTMDSVTEQEFLTKLHEAFCNQLPSYARPVFLRFCQQIEMTGTFKMRKLSLVKAGFDPNICLTDRIFYMDPVSKLYKRLDATIFNKISQGEIRL